VVAVVVLVVFDRDDMRPADQPSPSVTVPPTTPPRARGNIPHQLAPGTYFVDEVSGTPTPRIFATLGAGWRDLSNDEDWDLFKFDADTDAGAPVDESFQYQVGAMTFSNPVAVYSDACHWEGGFHPGAVDTLDGLVAALTAQRGWAEVTVPSDISVDGYVGKAFRRTAPADMSDCSTRVYRSRTSDDGLRPRPDFRSWEDAEGEFGGVAEPGQVQTLWVLDLDGTVVVITTGAFPEPSAGAGPDFAADVLDSIRIDRSEVPAAAPRRSASREQVHTGAADRRTVVPEALRPTIRCRAGLDDRPMIDRWATANPAPSGGRPSCTERPKGVDVTNPAIDKVLQGAVDAGAVPNAVAIAADDDGVIYEGAAGPVAVGGSADVGPDHHFRIASMTKIVTTVAALQQAERGNLDLDAPVEAYCPAFGELQVLDGFDGDEPRLRPPAGKATVRQLATHTSGLSYWFWNADVVHWEAATGTPNVMSGSASIFGAPLVADPGTRFEYGINTDWLGKVVESAGGQPLDTYFGEHILGPLGMAGTTFIMSPEQRANSVPVHVQGDDGGWTATEIDWNQQPDWWAGGHGLYSTPRDYVRFQRMLLGGGTLDDTQILRPDTVAAAFTNQIGGLDFPASITTVDPVASCDFAVGPDHKFGLGLLVNSKDQPGRRAAGSGAWAGIFNSHYWVDPTTRVTGAIYSQFLPFVTPAAIQMYLDFETALYASLS
jgi:methyl acetate hydrolase